MKKYLENNILISDGAFGTYYTQLTGSAEVPELANLNNKEIVKQIHTEYVEAGARLIRTNTFAADKGTLKINVEEQRELITNAYNIAMEVATEATNNHGGKIWVAADIGPIAENIFSTDGSVLEEYKTICDIFIELGAEVFLFETFSSLNYIEPIAKYIKENSDAFIITSFSLNPYGFTRHGMSAKRLINIISSMNEIDAFGFNCGVGASYLNKILKKLNWSNDKFITVMPNASYSEVVSGRSIYTDNVEYYVELMEDIYQQGVSILGGCCGTTPNYIKELCTTLGKKRILRKEYNTEEKDVTITIDYSKNELYKKLKKGNKVVAVELDPPYDANYDKLIEDSFVLKEHGVDIITIADSPMGKPRIDSILTAAKIKQMVNIPVLPHMCCRDKNIIAMKAQLLGANIHGIDNVLFVTGDGVPQGNRDEIKGVFNLNSVQLMKLAYEMNIENFSAMPIFYGGAIDLGKTNIEGELKKVIRKMEAGAGFFLTQPIYEERAIENLKIVKERTNAKILAGIMPIVSYKNARFMDNEIPGINIPKDVMERFEKVTGREEGEALGEQVALEVMEKLGDLADGYYFMVPFNRVHIITKILDMLKIKTN